MHGLRRLRQGHGDGVPNPYNYGLDTVKAAYLPHEHAMPMRYVIDLAAIRAGEGGS